MGRMGVMHVNWSQLWDYLYGNRLAIEGAVLFVVTSGIKTAPVPTSVWALWLYDWGHQLFNITNTRLNSTPTVTPPAPIPNAPK